jgi:uncharacterized protein (TIGR03086 family)
MPLPSRRHSPTNVWPQYLQRFVSAFAWVDPSLIRGKERLRIVQRVTASRTPHLHRHFPLGRSFRGSSVIYYPAESTESTMTDAVERHIQACEGFSEVVGKVEGRWERPSPCTDWDARGIVEHMIGFHDVLLLRPLNAKPQRPKGDPVERWSVTVTAISTVLRRIANDPASVEGGMSVPDLSRLLPALTAEVLVHTWDLARAVGVDPALDVGLCEITYEAARQNPPRDSGMFGAPVPVLDDADAGTKLVALLGRNPSWSAP